MGLRLQIEERSVGIARPLSIKLAVKARLGAHLAPSIARPETVDHQHDITAPIKVGGPSALARVSISPLVRLKRPPHPCRKHRRGAPLSAGRFGRHSHRAWSRGGRRRCRRVKGIARAPGPRLPHAKGAGLPAKEAAPNASPSRPGWTSPRRRIECFYRRQRAVEPLDLDHVSWPVQPCASFDVPASRVTTFGLPCTHNGFSLRIRGVVPGAGRELDDTGRRPRSAPRRRGTPRDRCKGGRCRHPGCLAPRRLADGCGPARGPLSLIQAGGAEVQLAVQARGRLVGDDLQWKARIRALRLVSQVGCPAQSA